MNRYDGVSSGDDRTGPKGVRALVTMSVAFALGIGLGLGAMFFLRSMRESAQASSPAVAAPSKSALESSSPVAEGEEDLHALVAELSAPEARSPARSTSSKRGKSSKKRPGSATVTGERTLEYWNLLNSIMVTENAMRAAPPNLTAGNAQAFVEQRARAFQFASTSVSGLDTRGVDKEVVTIGHEIAAWYQDGISHNAGAQQLFAEADEATRKGAKGQSWRQSEEEHRQRCVEINRRGAEVRERMAAKYGRPFPPLQ